MPNAHPKPGPVSKRSVGENLNDQLSQAARVRRYPVRLLGVLLRPLRQHLILLLLRELQVLLAEESDPWALRALEPGGKEARRRRITPPEGLPQLLAWPTRAPRTPSRRPR